MTFDIINNTIYDRWQKDDCDDVIIELLWYKVLDAVMRWVMGMDDKDITKEAIISLVRHFVNDDEIIQDAKALSDCFEEKD